MMDETPLMSPLLPLLLLVLLSIRAEFRKALRNIKDNSKFFLVLDRWDKATGERLSGQHATVSIIGSS